MYCGVLEAANKPSCLLHSQYSTKRCPSAQEVLAVRLIDIDCQHRPPIIAAKLKGTVCRIFFAEQILWSFWLKIADIWNKWDSTDFLALSRCALKRDPDDEGLASARSKTNVRRTVLKQGKEAMRNTIVAASVAVCLTTLTLGCKTAPKLAFWKSGDSADVESTALAHSAPSLPADVAKQAEALASSSPAIDMSTTPAAASAAAAPPYSPAPAYVPPAASVASTPATSVGSGTKSAPSFPTTGAASYATTTPSAAPKVAAATPPALYNRDQSADLGSVDMPYNPNAVPPARKPAAAVASAPTTSPATADRYGSASLASTYPATSTPAAPSFNSGSSSKAMPSTAATSPSLPASSGDRYSNAATSPAPSTTNPAPAYSSPAPTTPAMSPSVDRYASSGAPSSPITPTASVPPAIAATAPAVSTAPPVSSAPQVAKATPYRPGGTSSYEGITVEQSGIEIATRPNSASSTVPNATAPSSTPEPSEAPRYR